MLFPRTYWFQDAVLRVRAKLDWSPTILNRTPGAFDQETRKHAVYVHFDPKGAIAEYVYRQVDSLNELGYSVTFVTSGPELVPSHRQRMLQMSREVLQRRNAGYDFGAY